MRSVRMLVFGFALFLVGGMLLAVSFLILAAGSTSGAAPFALGILLMFIASLCISVS